MSNIEINNKKMSKINLLMDVDLDIVSNMVYHYLLLHFDFYSTSKTEQEEIKREYRNCKTKYDYIIFALKLDLSIDYQGSSYHKKCV